MNFSGEQWVAGAVDEAKNTLKSLFLPVQEGAPSPVGLVRNVVSGGKALYQSYQAFENARNNGASFTDAYNAANEVAKQHQAQRDIVTNRIKEFAKNPESAEGRAFTDVVLGLIGGAAAGPEAPEAMAGSEAAEAAHATAKGVGTAEGPGLVQRLVKGQEVEQAPAQAALKSVGSGEPSLREVLMKPIVDAQAKADSLYQQMDASGTDVKAITQKLRNTNQKLRQLTDTPEDQALESKLEQSRTGLMDQLKTSGVSQQLIDQADTQFQQTKALSDISNRVFKNPSIVEGDPAYGTPETVNVDSAIKALRKLQQTKYGDRLVQGLGQEGADKLLGQMYSAQRSGVAAIHSRVIATRLAKWAGLGIPAASAAAYGIKKLVE